MARRQSRDPLERYYSRPEFVRPLVIWLRRVAARHLPSSPRAQDAARAALQAESLIVEPCVGHGGLIVGALRTGLRSPRAPWRTVDLDPEARAAIWCGDWTEPIDSWRPRNRPARLLLQKFADDAKRATLFVTNPPFSRAIEILESCWRRNPNAVVALLQRQTWYEPTRDRVKFFCTHPPDVLTIGRCSFLRTDGQPVGGGDHTSYAWFVWGPGHFGLAGGLTRLIPWRGDLQSTAGWPRSNEVVRPGDTGQNRFRRDRAVRRWLRAKRPEADDLQRIICYRTEACLAFNRAQENAPGPVLSLLRQEYEWAVARLRELRPELLERLGQNSNY